MKDKHNPAPHPYHASPNYPGYEERINEEGHLETRPTVRRASPPKFRDNNATGNGDTAACGESDRSALRSDEAAVEGVDAEAIKAAHRAFDNAFCAGETTYRAVEEAIINYKAYLRPYFSQPRSKKGKAGARHAAIGINEADGERG
jgi:hypothetical protein